MVDLSSSAPPAPGPMLPGRPIRDAALRKRIAAALREAQEACQTAPIPTGAELASIDGASGALADAQSALLAALETATGAGGVARPAAALREIGSAREVLHNEIVESRHHRFTDVQAALGRLRSIDSVQAMIRAIPGEVCRCGFDRALLSRIEDSIWLPEAFHDSGDPTAEERVLAVGRRDRRRIDHLLLESEMIRRRTALVVPDAANDPNTFSSLRAATDTRSYVAAPLLPEGRVIGFLHADCYWTPRAVDEVDRDILWMLAEGIGYAIERTVLSERLRSLRGRVHGLTDEIDATIDSVADAEIEVVATQEETGAGRPHPIAPHRLRFADSADPAVLALLTRREREIMEHMARGASNQQIAGRLIISEGTVKTHVKHILRKLGANNRAEAVSRFLLTDRD